MGGVFNLPDSEPGLDHAIVGAEAECASGQTVLTGTLCDQTRLNTQRCTCRVSSYPAVLDTERPRLTAEQLKQAQRDALTTLVQLYKALGDGWQQLRECAP